MRLRAQNKGTGNLGSYIFVERPILAMVIAIVIVLLGVISLRSLPIEQYPDITPPMVEVSATYQGADALSVEESVATPIEESVNGVSGMIYMKSVNANDGSMLLQVTFDVGTDPDLNTIFTQNRVTSATPLLPASVITQGVTTRKTMGSFLEVFSLYSDGRYDQTYLSNYALINMQNRLERIEGVGQVQIMGAGPYSMRIWIKPDVIDYMGITVKEIVSAINQQSQIVPGGTLGAEPTSPETQFTYTVKMPAQYNTVEQFGGIIVRSSADGSQVHLSDIADIQLGSQTYDVYSTFSGKPSALVAIYQSPGSNAVAVGENIRAELADMSASFPDGIGYDIVVDSTKTIVLGIQDIIVTLLIALFLVILVIYIFTQDVRATIIPLIAIPVSLVGAFMVFPVLGFSINVFSMLAFVLAIGLVVDDAIVVVEAVQYNIEKGLQPREATLVAMKSVALPIVATTLTLMAVFLPVGLIPGAGGKLYQQFAITIAVTVFFSGVNALSLSPALCSLLLKKREESAEGRKENLLDRFFGWFNRGFAGFVTRYLRTTSVVVRHWARSLILVGIIAGVSLFIFTRVPTGFLPNEDQGYLLANINLPPASSLERTKAVCAQIEQMVIQNPNVSSVASAAGFSILSNTISPNSGIVFIELKDWKDRKMKADQITEMLNGEFYAQVSGGEVFAFGPPSIPGLGPQSGFTIMLQDKGSNPPEYLARYTEKFIEEAKKRPEIASASTLFDAYVPQRAITVDNSMALKSGVSLDELHGVISSFLGGMYVNNFNRFGRLYQTYIQAESQYRQNENDIDLFFVHNAQGQSFPLSSFVSVKDTLGPQFTNRYNTYRSAEVDGTPSPKYSATQAMEALEEVASQVLPADMDYQWSNMSYQEAQPSGIVYTFIYAVVFVFLILAALYESWSLPLSILMGIPFAVFGAASFIYLGHLLKAEYIDNIFFQVSLILLIGLAAKNAILIIEYAKDKFDEGFSLSAAAIEGAKLRIRPIIMTALAFILGVMPLVFATGSNAVARNTMGIALFGGMLLATFIGVFMYPMFFVVIGRWARYKNKGNNENKNDAQPKKP